MMHPQHHSDLPRASDNILNQPLPALRPPQYVLETIDAAASAVQVIKTCIARGELEPRLKPDGSWVTNADYRAHDSLEGVLPRIVQVPIISEEKIPPFTERAGWKDFWLIDPLDNTKGVVNGALGESRVNIALIRNGRLEFALVMPLEGDDAFVAVREFGVFKVKDGVLTPFPPPRTSAPLFAAYCDDFAVMAEETRTVLQSAGATKATLLKRETIAGRFESIFDGKASIYIEPRSLHGWDIAPFLLACELIGCRVESLREKTPLTFNSSSLEVEPFRIEIEKR